jgi:hypothetical protein
MMSKDAKELETLTKTVAMQRAAIIAADLEMRGAAVEYPTVKVAGQLFSLDKGVHDVDD